MNINTSENKSEENNKEYLNSEFNESKNYYDIFFIYDWKIKWNAKINIKNESTVSNAVIESLDQFNLKLKEQTNLDINIQMNPNLYEVFISNKLGNPKFDYPGYLISYR